MAQGANGSAPSSLAAWWTASRAFLGSWCPFRSHHVRPGTPSPHCSCSRTPSYDVCSCHFGCCTRWWGYLRLIYPPRRPRGETVRVSTDGHGCPRLSIPPQLHRRYPVSLSSHKRTHSVAVTRPGKAPASLAECDTCAARTDPEGAGAARGAQSGMICATRATWKVEPMEGGKARMKLAYTLLRSTTSTYIHWTLRIMPDRVTWRGGASTEASARCILARMVRAWRKHRQTWVASRLNLSSGNGEFS